MPRRKTPGAAPFSIDISLEAKLRFAGLHDALGFRTKAETFEAIVYAASTKDKIDPAAIERIERKLDRFLGRLHNLIRVNADGTSAEPLKLTNDERKKRISESCCRHLHEFATSSEKTVIQHFSRSRANSTTNRRVRSRS